MEGHQQNAGTWCAAMPLHPPVPPTPRVTRRPRRFGTLPPSPCNRMKTCTDDHVSKRHVNKPTNFIGDTDLNYYR